ncbi:MAG: phosphoadenosine phosphosulfate reductase [Paracoccaceae bacterium]
MQDSTGDVTPLQRLGKTDWIDRLRDLGNASGFFHDLGRKHHALLTEAGPALLVTFETVESAMARPDQMPVGHGIALAQGWSHLCLLADGQTWFRDPAVFDFVDGLIDQAFFEDFEDVLFYGTGQGGYAAASFSVAAPGAQVVMIQPQATLDPAVTGWDSRFLHQRRLCFTDRYGYAPEMLDGAGAALVIYDPAERFDAMHAALFARPYVQMLRCRNLGATLEESLLGMAVLQDYLASAMGDGATAAAFHRLYRARRDDRSYLNRLLAVLEMRGRLWLAYVAARELGIRLNAPRYRRKQEQLAADLDARGISLPGRAPVYAQR